jgi:hypothetical protein
MNNIYLSPETLSMDGHVRGGGSKWWVGETGDAVRTAGAETVGGVER